MADRPFESMTRVREPYWYWTFDRSRGMGTRCDDCGTLVYRGDWPFCKGDPADHRRD